jgi:uncharacterized glyoxalase superfamily protein PhnB
MPSLGTRPYRTCRWPAPARVLMIGNPGPAYQEPRHHAETCGAARTWLAVPFVIDGVHVYVGDIDAHCTQARGAGATILSEPEDTGYGDRRYRAEDPAGHRWMFAHRMSDG